MKSFLIRDILSAGGQQQQQQQRQSPSDSSSSSSSISLLANTNSSSAADQHLNHQRQQQQQEQQQQQQQQQHQLAQQFHLSHMSQHSPLDALFQMTSSTFDALKRGEKRKDRSSDSNHGTPQSYTGKQSSKKKRKSRTAFTNHQIYELERRFGIQKYLSPTDRDEIAMTLNLSNAQVITWFQNRRAKLKRDLEEKKRDIETASLLNLHKTFLESLQALSQMNAAMKPNDAMCVTPGGERPPTTDPTQRIEID